MSLLTRGLDVTHEGPGELVAVLNAAYGLNPNSGDFIYTDLLE